MSQKCVHKGCGKVFNDPEEPCVYHPGPPEFHEGQKGWKCCKPRVLTFDEFLDIPPCTTGKHSTVDDTPKPEPKREITDAELESLKPKPAGTDSSSNTLEPGSSATAPTRRPIQPSTDATLAVTEPPSKPSTPQPPEDDSDDPDTPVPENTICKRRACGQSYDKTKSDKRDLMQETCIYHPGAPLFHEGSKGWTCCKRRVLEFDQFMRIEGCKERAGHCFVGKKKSRKSNKQRDGTNGDPSTTAATTTQSSHDQTTASQAGPQSQTNNDEEDEEEIVETVRNDFYQTVSSVIVSFYLKKIDKDRASIVFDEDGKSVRLDLPTTDGKRFRNIVPLYADIVPDKSTFKILGTKLEMSLAKKDGLGWPVLRSDERLTGERIQVGRAGRV